MIQVLSFWKTLVSQPSNSLTNLTALIVIITILSIDVIVPSQDCAVPALQINEWSVKNRGPIWNSLYFSFLTHFYKNGPLLPCSLDPYEAWWTQLGAHRVGQKSRPEKKSKITIFLFQDAKLLASSLLMWQKIKDMKFCRKEITFTFKSTSST